MIYDLNRHIGIPPKPPANPEPVHWPTVIKLVVVLLVLVWMENRDREHIADNRALVEVVAVQQSVIDGMECGVGLEMIVPIDRVQM